MKNAFLICPVRGHDPSETEEVVRSLEKSDWTIHWPHRDTDQEDATGLRICETNRRAIEQSDRVFIVWDGKSTGCLFDLGMAFALRKEIAVLSLPKPTESKSFQNMIMDWERRQYTCVCGGESDFWKRCDTSKDKGS